MISCSVTVSIPLIKNSWKMSKKKSSKKLEESEIILVLQYGQAIMKFYKGYTLGDGEEITTRKIIINYSNG